MVPRLSKPGRSFRAAHAYYSHDKDTNQTAERVGWTHVMNVRTSEPDKAVVWMIASHRAANDVKDQESARGRRIEKPVFTWSLSAAPGQDDPGEEYWMKAAKSFLTEYGLEDHPTVLYHHTDEDYSHVHGMTSLIDPRTFRAKTDQAVSNNHLKASRWAQRWEETEDHQVFCKRRVENNAKRAEGEYVKYRDPELEMRPLITRLYQSSDNGKSFQAALEQAGYKLAGGRRIVIIDPQGKIHSISRQIEGVKAKDIRAKLADLEFADVEHVRAQHQLDCNREKEPVQDQEPERPQSPQTGSEPPFPAPTEAPLKDPEPKYFDRDRQDRDWQESVIDAGIEADQEKRTVARAEKLNREQERRLAQLGKFYEESAQARMKLSAQLEAAYGEQETGLRDDIGHLDSTLRRSGRLKLWWMKVTGQVSKTAEQDLTAKRKTLENIKWRKREAMEALEKEIEVNRQRIAERQQKKERKPSPRTPDQSPAPGATLEAPRSPASDFAPAAQGPPPTPSNDNDIEREAKLAAIKRQIQRRRETGPSRSR